MHDIAMKTNSIYTKEADLLEKDLQLNRFIEYAGKGNKAGMEKLLEIGGLDYNARSILFENRSALDQAAAQGQTQIVDYLIKLPAIRLDNDEGSSLHYAVHSGNVDVVEKLLKANADFTVKDSSGDTPIQTAIQMGYPHIVKVFMDWGVPLAGYDLMFELAQYAEAEKVKSRNRLAYEIEKHVKLFVFEIMIGLKPNQDKIDPASVDKLIDEFIETIFLGFGIEFNRVKLIRKELSGNVFLLFREISDIFTSLEPESENLKPVNSELLDLLHRVRNVAAVSDVQLKISREAFGTAIVNADMVGLFEAANQLLLFVRNKSFLDTNFSIESFLLPLAKKLINANLDKDMSDSWGLDPVQWAQVYGYKSIAALFESQDKSAENVLATKEYRLPQYGLQTKKHSKNVCITEVEHEPSGNFDISFLTQM